MLSAAGMVQAAGLPDILVNHDGLIGGVQDTSGPAGGSFTYRAKVKLNGGDDATGVVLTEVLPIGAIYLSRSSTPSGISCSPTPASGTVLTNANNTFTCNVGNLGSADGFKWVDFNVVLPTVSATWTATASAALPAPDGTTDGDGGVNNVGLTRNFTTNDATDLGVKLTSNAPVGGVNNGDTYNYTIQVTNYGPTALPNGGFAKVTFQIPSGAPVTGNDALGGGGWACAPATGPVAANAIISCTYPAAGMPTGSYGYGQPLPPITIPVQSQMGGPIGAAVSVEGFQDATTPWPDGQKGNNTDSLIVQSTGADYTDVSLTKSVAPQLVDASNPTPVTYTLQVRRETGALQPEQIVVTDTLPAGVTFGAFDAGNDTRWGCSQAAGTITCSWNGGAPYTGNNNTNLPAIKFTANVAAQAAGNAITNDGTVTVKPGTEPNTANNKGSATVTFNNTAQLSLAKSGPSAPVKRGVPFQYTLTIKNEGPMPIAANAPISLTDTPSANLRLLSVNGASSANWTCSAPPTGAAGVAATCENSSALAVGASIRLVLDAQVDTIPGGSDYVTVGNNAATGTVPGRDGGSAGGNATVTVSDQAADLVIAKVVQSAPANPKSGDAITYRITVTNKAGSTQTAQDVKITDTLTNLVIPDDGVAGSNPLGGYVSAVVSSPLPGYLAGAGYPAGTTTVSCPAASATAITGLTGTATSRNRNLTCTVDYLAVGQSVSVDVTIKPRITTATPAATTAMTYTNSASANSTYINDPTPGDNTASADIPMTSLVELTVDKQVSPTTEVAAGQPATYTVTVKNQGPSSAQNVKMVDTLPANAILVGEPTVPSGGVCTHSGGVAPLNGKQGGTMTCTWATALAAQSQYVVTYKARSVGGNPAPGAKMDNSVHVSTDTEEIRLDNNDAAASIALKPAQLDVQIQMSHSDDGLVLGGTTEYTITIKNDNASSSYATNVKMSELFPAGGSTATFSYQGGLTVAGVGTNVPGYVSGVGGVNASMCGTVPAMNATTGPLECTIPLMAPGDTVTIKFTLKADSLPAGAKNGTIFHQATVKPAETEYMPGYDALANNATTDRTSTSATANGVDMGVKKQGPGGVPKAGDTVTYTITVTNYGQTVPAPAGTMTDTLPAGLNFVSASSSTPGATCAGTVGSSAPVVCQVPAGVAKGASIVYTVVTQVSNPFTGTYPLVNKAEVNVPGDSNPDNNKDEVKNGNPPPPNAIPTLSEWGLIALSLLLAAFALRRMPLQPGRRS
ncbi:DUF11 domain-containing protein [Pulveribacter sp.]|uniref:DUF11 domain-containing protein n=1 Tax=Pulveribacter sp. TaxID=2678893 RepID=UPI0028AEE1E4|nr:DUF11 domain-containing protein [Pulveribacter sp.]